MEKMIIDGKEVEVIDVTPTWIAMLPVYITILESGDSESRSIAKLELANMARMADLAVEIVKEKQKEIKPNER